MARLLKRLVLYGKPRKGLTASFGAITLLVMASLLFLAFLVGWQLLLFKVVIACVVFWAIWQLVIWAGWPIPRPVVIIATALFIILVIYWLFELFNVLL